MTVTADLDHILATIRAMESGGNYTARNPTSTASGAYQYLDSTWNNFGGYAHAYQAPPAVQDARARADVTRITAAHPNDLTAVPQFWYYPAGYGHPDLVPPGNSLSIGQYVSQWMAKYGGTTGGTTPAIAAAASGPAVSLVASSTAGGDPSPAVTGVLKSLDGVLNTKSSGLGALLDPIGDLRVIVSRSAIVLGGLVISTFGLLLIVQSIGGTKSGGAATNAVVSGATVKSAAKSAAVAAL